MALLDETISAGQSGHITDHQQLAQQANSVHDAVNAYGCVGDDSTNNTTPLQAALDAAGNSAATRGRAGVVVLEPGIYRTDALTIPPGVKVLGLGHGRTDNRYGAWLSARANDQIIVQIESAGSIVHEGFQFENVGFYSHTFTGVTGAKIDGVTRWHFVNCNFMGPSGTPMATGIWCSYRDVAGNLKDCAWWSVESCTFRRCQTGMDVGGYGGSIIACDFVPESAQSGEVGVLLRATESPVECVSNTVIDKCMFDQSATTSYGILMRGTACRVTNSKFEGRHNTGSGIRVEANGTVSSSYPSGWKNLIIGNTFSQHDGSGSIAVHVTESDCQDTGIFMNQFLLNATDITDSGTRTQDFHNHKTANTWT